MIKISSTQETIGAERRKTTEDGDRVSWNAALHRQHGNCNAEHTDPKDTRTRWGIQHSTMEKEGTHEVPPIPEELLAVNGCLNNKCL